MALLPNILSFLGLFVYETLIFILACLVAYKTTNPRIAELTHFLLSFVLPIAALHP